MSLKSLSSKNIWIFVIILMFLLVISTNYIGSTDVGDYAGTAKFFAGEYDAKIRSSHSYSYGYLSSPFVKFSGSLIGMKIMSLVWLLLLMASIYHISRKDKKTLLLIITSPIFWYMSPWINPIQIASLFFLWGYFFIELYNKNNSLKHLTYSGLFIGLSWVFWDTILFFGIILGIVYLWDKKFSHSIYFITSVLTGLIPRLILDQILFNFPLYSILRSLSSNLILLFFSGTSGISGHSSSNILNIIIVLLMLPLFSFLFLKPKFFKENKKATIFLIFSLLLILINPQSRYTLLITPIILTKLSNLLTDKQFKIHIILSIILSIIVITPYLIQINHDSNAEEITSLIRNIDDISLNRTISNKLIISDLDDISSDFPNQRFVVGDDPDFYKELAIMYWGDNITEFISIQDYQLEINGENVIFEKEFRPVSNIKNRREIWIKGGISKSSDDQTNYNAINYSISNNREIDLKGFTLKKSYKLLNVFQKTNNL